MLFRSVEASLASLHSTDMWTSISSRLDDRDLNVMYRVDGWYPTSIESTCRQNAMLSSTFDDISDLFDELLADR